MILIFGGTTEGRVATKVCDMAAKPYIYSTKNGDQQLLSSHARVVFGALSSTDIIDICSSNNIKLIVDAAHPYASNLHTNISNAAAALSIPTIRFERERYVASYNQAIEVENIDEGIAYIRNNNIVDIFATTGMKSATKLAPISKSNNVLLRIMDREESNQQIELSRFPFENVIYYDFDKRESDEQFCRRNQIKAILTKESGESGGFSEKVRTAQNLDIPIIIIKRPQLPSFTRVVYGEHGLRREIESLLPGFYELRSGFTTGSAATAASLAATLYLLTGSKPESVDIKLPNGEYISIAVDSIVSDGDSAICTVIKDGGDDPDATHNIAIVSKVEAIPNSHTNVVISGGEGVGKVTLPGIGIEVGDSAINPVPMQMIENNIKDAIRSHDSGSNYHIAVEVSVPNGSEIAKRTFNPRLGIIDGISILGTSGIVKPFSSEAFLESIERQIDIVAALGHNQITINSGAKSERYIKSLFPHFAPQAYIQYGNLIGETIKIAASKSIERVVLGVMIGKAVKLANGALDTHSKHSLLDHDFIQSLAERSKCNNKQIEAIKKITTARELWDIAPKEHLFFKLIIDECYRHCKPLLPNGKLEIVLISEADIRG